MLNRNLSPQISLIFQSSANTFNPPPIRETLIPYLIDG